MDYKPILPLVLIFALLSQFSITFIDAKKASPDVPPTSATTRAPGYYVWSVWNVQFCGCTGDRYQYQECLKSDHFSYDNRCKASDVGKPNVGPCDNTCDNNGDSGSSMGYVVIVFGMVTMFLFFVLVVCIISTRRARRRVIRAARRQLLEQARMQNALGIPNDSAFLNDTEVGNILRQMPPPPPKYEEIPAAPIAPPQCSQWPDESESPPRYEEISASTPVQQLNVSDLSVQTEPIQTANSIGPVANVLSSITVEIVATELLPVHQTTIVDTNSSSSYSNSAFEMQ